LNRIEVHLPSPSQEEDAMTDRAPVRSYSTDFPLEEDPISEGGMWINGKTDGIDWTDVISGGGVVYGALSRMDVAEKRIEQGNLESDADTAPVGDYDDPTAVLSGEWGPDQHATATVHSRNPTAEYFQEVQIRLRTVIEPNNCTGYEVFWRALKTGEGYAEIVRWNGPVGDFTSLQKLFGPDYGVEHGDVVEATIEGTALKGFINGVEVISAIDDVFDSGAPGVGFNFGVGDTNVDHGFSSFAVDSYDG
jgi:predicted RNA-binding protein